MEALDEFTLHQSLAGLSGQALVLFTSSGCGTCRSVERRLPEAAPAGVRLYKVDVQQAQALARAYEVFHLPALFLFVDGHFHARLNCEVTPAALGRALLAALAAPAQEEP
ncbi:MAG TPA: thioredoxin family protein [Thiobacillaceae bacterium]|nr:thioredoxin family protein [Thiobacillaceae bacterium]